VRRGVPAWRTLGQSSAEQLPQIFKTVSSLSLVQERMPTPPIVWSRRVLSLCARTPAGRVCGTTCSAVTACVIGPKSPGPCRVILSFRRAFVFGACGKECTRHSGETFQQQCLLAAANQRSLQAVPPRSRHGHRHQSNLNLFVFQALSVL
jgi:hypothetical protein